MKGEEAHLPSRLCLKDPAITEASANPFPDRLAWNCDPAEQFLSIKRLL